MYYYNVMLTVMFTCAISSYYTYTKRCVSKRWPPSCMFHA